MQELFVSAVLAIHLLAVNLSCGGPLLCLLLRGRVPASDRQQGDSARYLAWLSLWALMVGMATGTILFFLPGTEDLRSILSRLPASAYWAAGGELVFSALLLWAYAGLWQRMRGRPWAHAFIALLATTNLIYHFPQLMIVLGKLAVDPSWVTESVLDRPILLRLMYDSEVLSLACHFALASLAVGGVTAIAVFARQKDEELQEASRSACRWAAFVAVFASLLQLPIGVWVLITISDPERGALIGGNLFASSLFLGSLLSTMYLLQGLVKIAIGNFDHRDCSRVLWLLVFIVLMMTTTLRMSRSKDFQGSVDRAAHERNSN